MPPLVDQFGRAIPSTADLRLAEIHRLRRQILRARYDSAQTSVRNQEHWKWADNLDPHSANSPEVRRKLRSRSRYEASENNPYLKGWILSLANDFVGAGPRLKITDQRLSPNRRKLIELRNRQWGKATRRRYRLWRMRTDKMVSGEAFSVAFQNSMLRHPVKLDFHVFECDRVTSLGVPLRKTQANEIDGVRFDGFEQPTQYHILRSHPGRSPFGLMPGLVGDWRDARVVVHWFRKDRAWLRGIPETTPSLELCALLRRYTLAAVQAAEVAADFAAVLETEGPANPNAFGSVDDPYDQIPIERGMMVTLPWRTKLSQMRSEQPTTTYDTFVFALLKEIARPLLIPFNMAIGSSQDSNMSSAVVDSHIYKSGVNSERLHCDDEVLDKELSLWWRDAIESPGYIDDPLSEADFLSANPTLRSEPPMHEWRWDRVGLDHTDPQKVANAIATWIPHMTQAQIQEEHFNRDVDEWREEVREDMEFAEEVGLGTPVVSEVGPEEDEAI